MKKPWIDPKTLHRAANTLRVIAHPDRLRIIEKLKVRKCSVGELVVALGLPQAVVSKHLALLKNAGLLSSEADANFRHYSLTNTHVLDVLNCIKKSCPNTYQFQHR
ncbi:MAG: metalloregulator ArsR/SmtB family transcription factor [Candidatus Omnitrophota bacterium]